MTQEHPTTPPPELVEEWCSQLFGCDDKPEIAAYELARLAARWGADQELEECCEYISGAGSWFARPEHRIAELRAARRPKPPSLKQQALEILDDVEEWLDSSKEEWLDSSKEEWLDSSKYDTLHRALETLPDD